jgi:peptide-methionine (S)-S-oxide reductase
MKNSQENIESIILGGGCFWCLEAVYKRIPGVTNVQSGYAGGKIANPTYQDVCSGNTGHAEVTKVEFDKNTVTLEKVLKVFFLAHDPTTLNRQGNDIGTQYRSVIFYLNGTQKEISEKILAETQQGLKEKIVTEIKPLDIFYEAEDYHQNYYDNNTNQAYCRFVIQPKLDKILKRSN